MESWRKVWREAIVPLLSDKALKALRRALEDDDVRLVQGATTVPPPLACVTDWPVEGCCALGFCGLAEGLETVGEVEEFFAQMCFQIDQRLGEPAGCRWFLNQFDTWPREEMIANLLPEVVLALSERETKGVAA